MVLRKQIGEAGDALLRLDKRTKEVAEPHVDSAPVKALDLFSKLGDQPQVRLISGGLLLAGVFSGNARLTRAGARMMIAHEAATLAKNLLKTNVDRTRPRSANHHEEVKPTKGKHEDKETTSFPSGHTAGSIAAARGFGREYPEHATAALAAAAVVAASQIPRAAHYPTDVAAGAVVGLVAEAAVDALWRAADMDERSES